jgi:hypothetical protein
MEVSDHPFILLAIAAERLDRLPAENRDKLEEFREFRRWLQHYSAVITSMLAGDSRHGDDEPARHRQLCEKLLEPDGQPLLLLALAVQQLDQLDPADKQEFRTWLRLYDLMLELDIAIIGLMRQQWVNYDEPLRTEEHPSGWRVLDRDKLQDLIEDAVYRKKSSLIGRIVETSTGLGFEMDDERA